MDGTSEIVAPRFEPELLAQMETPCYVFDPATVIATYSRLKAVLGTPLVVSLKANSCIDLFVRCAHVFTDGIELASQGELDLVIGRTSAPKFVNTPALGMQLLGAAVASRATAVLDNLHQVEMAVALAGKVSTPIRVALRVNATGLAPDAVGSAHADHFGMDPEALLIAATRLSESRVEVRGLHVFAGSYTFGACGAALCANADALIARIETSLRKRLEFINLGGGFADDWSADDGKFEDYRRQLVKLQERLTVMHEAGRAIFSRGGVFATKVLAVKSLNGRHVVICDGGLAHCFMLAQTEKVLKRRKKPRVISSAGDPQDSTSNPIVFVGNSCNRADVIGEWRNGVVPHTGDLVLFDDCGSYHTYTPTNFLQLKPARHYVVS